MIINRKNRVQGRLFCFSPEVMLATFLFETGAALYTLWRYRLTNVTRLVVAILVCLAIFQAAEYAVCGGGGLIWAKIGFIAITMLPPLGIHLAASLAKKKVRRLVSFVYGTALLFIIFFIFLENAITNQVCYGNYVIFSHLPGLINIYTVYYYSLLLVGVFYSTLWARTAVPSAKKSLRALSIGYLLFILPTTAANIVDPSTISAIPSIMCGFAVLLACALVFGVLPNTVKRKFYHSK